MHASGATAEELGGAIWSQQVRHLGVGAMVVGGTCALVSMRGSLLDGIKSGLTQYRSGSTVVTDHTDMDMPMKYVLIGISVFVIPIFMLYQSIVASVGIGLVMTVIMVIA